MIPWLLNLLEVLLERLAPDCEVVGVHDPEAQLFVTHCVDLEWHEKHIRFMDDLMYSLPPPLPPSAPLPTI